MQGILLQLGNGNRSLLSLAYRLLILILLFYHYEISHFFKWAAFLSTPCLPTLSSPLVELSNDAEISP
jgi:hypothetical protein